LIGLADVAWRLGQPRLSVEQIKRVNRWFWATTYGEYFTGMSGRRIRDAIDHLRAVLESDKNPIPSDLVREVPQIKVFNFRATRSKALMLLTTTQIGDLQLREQTQRWLGERGNEAVHNLIPSAEARRPENRVVALPDELQSLRRALTVELHDLGLVIGGKRQSAIEKREAYERRESQRRALLTRYLIPDDAPLPPIYPEPDQIQIDQLLEGRRNLMILLEQDCLSEIGLTLRPDEQSD
jgi:hypothetical protein